MLERVVLVVCKDTVYQLMVNANPIEAAVKTSTTVPISVWFVLPGLPWWVDSATNKLPTVWIMPIMQAVLSAPPGTSSLRGYAFQAAVKLLIMVFASAVRMVIR